MSDKGGIAAHGQTVAAGLSVAVDVAYGPTSEVEHQDRLVVFVDDEEAVEIPLVGLVAWLCMSVLPYFVNVNIN